MKNSYFHDGLKEGIKDLLVTVKRSPVFDIFVNQCIDLDNRLHERKHSSNPSTSRPQDPKPHPSAPTPSYPTPSSSSQVVPMEIDAVKCGPISAEEKARRKKEGLCFYCACLLPKWKSPNTSTSPTLAKPVPL